LTAIRKRDQLPPDAAQDAPGRLAGSFATR